MLARGGRKFKERPVIVACEVGIEPGLQLGVVELVALDAIG